MTNKNEASVKAAAARYLKLVEWSDKDRVFVGRCPGLFYGGCHGSDEARVYRRLCKLVEEHVAELIKKREALPTATAGKTYSGKFLVRIGSDLHRKAALKALSRGESLNQFVAEAIAES
jgi:predicted HicB family RNase H-like nuclease